MFILKRQDVEITNIRHPSKDQQIPILNYQDQTFRLISVFNAAQEEEARAFWRDLTDNQGKACVLLEETERYSVWGKVRLEQQANVADKVDVKPTYTQACLLLLQSVYLEIEDLLGNKQADSFAEDIAKVFSQWRFPEADSSSAVNHLLQVDPLATTVPPWQEHHLNTLLQELHRLGKGYFGNTNFIERVLESLEDMSENDQAQFNGWLEESPIGKLWQ